MNPPKKGQEAVPDAFNNFVIDLFENCLHLWPFKTDFIFVFINVWIC